MRTVDGVVNVVQEGRFRLALADGRSALFQLARNAPLEPQDLEPIAAQGLRVRVHYTEIDQRGAALAHDLTRSGTSSADGPPAYFRERR